jgi:hypothetical protein
VQAVEGVWMGCEQTGQDVERLTSFWAVPTLSSQKITSLWGDGSIK